MQPETQTEQAESVTAKAPEVRFAANDVRLTLRGWLVAAVLIGSVLYLVPKLWRSIEPLKVGPDYRVPYRLGNDYWNYERTCRQMCRGDDTLLVGDSVLWGHYVDSDGTLSHYLNEKAKRHRFANLGVDGIHPIALAGLVENSAKPIRGKRVILNCNLLWTSSPRHDLSTHEETRFNHPSLVPQLFPKIACYNASTSERLGIVASRHLEFLRWADHLRIAYFGSDDLATWTIDHPRENPIHEVTLELPSPDEPPSPAPDPRPWNEKGIRPLTPEWVPLGESLQWRFFRRTVQRLRQRDNRVFVLIGPLNEHMLTEKGLAEYTERKQQVAAWCEQEAIPHYTPLPLPSQTYADLSHPTSAGYALLAEQLLAQQSFQAFLGP